MIIEINYKDIVLNKQPQIKKLVGDTIWWAADGKYAGNDLQVIYATSSSDNEQLQNANYQDLIDWQAKVVDVITPDLDNDCMLHII